MSTAPTCRRVPGAAVAMLVLVAVILAQPGDAFFKAWRGAGAADRRQDHGFGNGHLGSVVIDEAELTQDLRGSGDDNAADDLAGFGGVMSVPDSIKQAGDALLKNYKSKDVSFGSCWKEAVAKLEDACSAALVDDDVRSRLGIAFTTCQMKSDGKGHLAPACHEANSVPSCLKAFDEATAYSVYVQYRLHVDALCFHIQQEMFRERSNEAVARLHAATKAAGSHLSRLSSRAQEWDGAVTEIKRRQDEAAAATQALGSSMVKLQNLEHTLSLALNERIKPIAEIGDRLEGVITQQKELEVQHREAAKRAESHASASTQALERLATGTRVLENGIADAKAATSALAEEHVAAHKGLDDVKLALAEVKVLQSQSVDRALAVAKQVDALASGAEAKLGEQQKLLDQLQAHTKTLVAESTDHQNAIADSATTLLSGIAEIQAFQENFASAVISVEAAAVYVVASMATMLLTVPAQTNAARFPALVLGPLSCFIVERFYPVEAAVQLSRAGFGPDLADFAATHNERMPPSTAAAMLRGGGGGLGGGSSSASGATMGLVRLHYVPMIRQLFTSLVFLLLFIAAARYETPESMQRRVVGEVVASALRDPAVLQGLADAAATLSKSTNNDDADGPTPGRASITAAPAAAEDAAAAADDSEDDDDGDAEPSSNTTSSSRRASSKRASAKPASKKRASAARGKKKAASPSTSMVIESDSSADSSSE